MKIGINLAQPENRLERSVYLWAPVGMLLAAVLLAHLCLASAQQLMQYRKVHRSVMQYQAEVRGIQAQEQRLQSALRQPATLRLYSQINFLNSLIAQKKVSLSGLTLEVAKLLPPQARILALSLDGTARGRGPVVEVRVEGSASQVAGEFLSHLEASPDFDTVTVLDQSFEPQSVQPNMVSLTCSARFVGKTLPGQGLDQAQP